MHTRALSLAAAVADVALALLSIPAALVLKLVRRIGLQRLPLCRGILMKIGVLPVRRHYYEPFVVQIDVERALSSVRSLPAIDWNLPAQRAFLQTLTFESELEAAAHGIRGPSGAPFDFDNASFRSGDAEMLYQVVRRLRPANVIEIGSGLSTILVKAALEKNRTEAAEYRCAHTCIEPFEARWLESVGVRLLRQRVETVPIDLFSVLGDGDLLFVDSSHIIRPHGDVLVEYLQILPVLRRGVVVHIHDIFSPRDYPRSWILEKRLLWNEQYLLEAFLSNNDQWRVLAAVNMLKHEAFDDLSRVCPYVTREREPGSFYIQRYR